jgi:hypothetical protein
MLGVILIGKLQFYLSGEGADVDFVCQQDVPKFCEITGSTGDYGRQVNLIQSHYAQLVLVRAQTEGMN